jgi:hypothetical protein
MGCLTYLKPIIDMFHGMFNIPETNYRYVLNSEHRLLYGRTALTDFCMEEQL